MKGKVVRSPRIPLNNPFPDVHISKIWRCVAKRGHTRQETEDILQEAFLKVFVFLQAGGKVETSLEGFVLRIAMNCATDSWRRGKSHLHTVSDKEAEVLSAELPSGEEEVEAEQHLRKMRAEVSKLGERTVKIFFLFTLEDYTYKEIADRLRMPARTVEKHIARAYKVLATMENRPCARKKTSR